MIKIHGLSVSNHSAMIKFAMLEKNIDYEWVETLPYSMSKDESILEKSAIGAVPILEYEGVFISETMAIFGFLEKKFPDIKLTSSDPFEYARSLEIMKICQLYIELQARNFYPFVFFGGEKKEDNKDQIKDKINMGLKSIEKKASLNPYIVDSFSFADIFVSLALWPTIEVCKQIYKWNILEEFKKISNSLELINNREAGKKVYDDILKGMEAMNK